MAQPRVQQLYEVCNQTFRGAKTPSVEAIGKVRAVLGETTTAV